LRTDSLTSLVDWLLEKTPESEPARTDGVRADPLAIAESFKNPNTSPLRANYSRWTKPA
jgi:hypothetical protein